MQNQFGTAGKSVREMARQRRRTIYFILAIVTILTLADVIFLANNNNVRLIGGGATLVILVLLYLLPSIADRFLKKPEKEYGQMKRGAVGEEVVGALLAQLGADYVVQHDTISPYGNIDHIVYDSRGNIFMLETKSHRGRVTAEGEKLLLNGHDFEKDILHQALNNSFWLKEKLEAKLGVQAWITPVLVFTKAFVTFRKPIKGVHYLHKKYLLEFILKNRASSPAGVKLWEIKRKV